MTILWGTDWHLNFLKKEDATLMLCQYIAEENPDADCLILTGDISSGEVLEKHLTQLAQGFPKPIYFVLGNHDYYNSSFDRTDSLVTNLTKKFDNLHWLQEGNHFHNGISIVGVCGWYDVRHGNTSSRLQMADFSVIEDLLAGNHYKELMIELVRKRAAKEAIRLDELLSKEISDTNAKTVLVATHLPPYHKACWHAGKMSDREWMPWFTCHATGEVLDQYADNFPDKQFIVLTGHTHSPGIYQRSKNLVIYTGVAEYGAPDLSGTINVTSGKINILNELGTKVERDFP